MKRLIGCALALLTWTGLAVAQDVCAPAKINNLVVDGGKSTIALTWNNSGDDCNTGTAYSFEVRRWTSAITDMNWQDADIVATGSPNGGNGSGQCVNLESQTCNTTYYWVVFLIDEAGNRSPLGNVVQRATLNCESTLEVSC